MCRCVRVGRCGCMLGGRQGGGLAGSEPGQISANIPDPIQIRSRSHPDPAVNPIPFFKIDQFVLLAKEMSTHVVMLLMAYLMLLGTSRK